MNTAGILRKVVSAAITILQTNLELVDLLDSAKGPEQQAAQAADKASEPTRMEARPMPARKPRLAPARAQGRGSVYLSTDGHWLFVFRKNGRRISRILRRQDGSYPETRQEANGLADALIEQYKHEDMACTPSTEQLLQLQQMSEAVATLTK